MEKHIGGAEAEIESSLRQFQEAIAFVASFIESLLLKMLQEIQIYGNESWSKT